jgi:hypothetical protein
MRVYGDLKCDVPQVAASASRTESARGRGVGKEMADREAPALDGLEAEH